MRVVFETLERLGVPYFVTGSVAAGVRGVLRQTHGADVVVDLTAVDLRQLTDTFHRTHRLAGLGPVWVASVEDLILARLRWSEGVSDLQLRDCSQLLTIGGTTIAQACLDRWATALGIDGPLARARDAA